MSTEYYLFLDESKPNGQNIHHLCLAGLIIKKETYENEIIPEVRALKNNVFGNTEIILHESEVRAAKDQYTVLRQPEKRNEFWQGMANIFRNFSLTTIGASIHINDYKTYYSDSELNDEYYIVLQIVLENFVHFLRNNDAKGQVYIEGINTTDDIRLRNTYHKIIANGTLYYNPNAFQDRLININFQIKADNNIGLQLADFVPGTLNRHCNGLNPKNPGILPLINAALYDGGHELQKRFGFKVLP
ncbi:DUF3800 domain-containing protein [Domibacillus sp. A3M-37]|uniref:DUF3800 domain-containing protein n=1 Tax=Domibacillus sp. A3M-37 TaxID=2962037 RepID=UPI0020B64A25|nr:DUF3800 domain-containing protein [Domibacillus sp. A3M-37]MCP3763698.1 DUF3800 domain-containing protein [Domibacillus sp. A3M-37]